MQGDAKKRLTLALLWKMDGGRRSGLRWVTIILLEGSCFILFKESGKKCDKTEVAYSVSCAFSVVVVKRRKGETREVSYPLENPQGCAVGGVGFCQPLPPSTCLRTGHPRKSLTNQTHWVYGRRALWLLSPASPLRPLCWDTMGSSTCYLCSPQLLLRL